MIPTQKRARSRSHEYSRWYAVPATLHAGLELEFRRAVRQVPTSERRGLRAWLRRYRRHYRHEQHAARTVHELDPATGHWHCL